MARAKKTHRQVGEDYLAGAKQRVSHRFDLPASAVWAALLDGKAWTEWLPLTRVVWTSPQPFGVGTTRTVSIGEMDIDEVFFAWEEGRRMAFCFAASALPVSAAVEDYRVVEVPGGCELQWAGRA
ncbi:MAG: SRPBCC family protein, partial [Caulobacteraceae bacterium]